MRTQGLTKHLEAHFEEVDVEHTVQVLGFAPMSVGAFQLMETSRIRSCGCCPPCNRPIAFGGAKEPEIVHFTIERGAKKHRNPPNYRPATVTSSIHRQDHSHRAVVGEQIGGADRQGESHAPVPSAQVEPVRHCQGHYPNSGVHQRVWSFLYYTVE